jgi:outer membrane protein OmpA-like peptidoglycan-associated protein
VAEPALEREPAPVPEPAPAPEPVAEPGSAASAPSPVLALASAPAVAPVIVPEVPDRGPFLLLYPSGSARWEDGGKTVLASLIERMRDRQDVVLVIEGHTDSRGEPGVNDRLSHRRAEGVAAVFRAAGFPSARILVRAYGATRPRVTSGDLGALRLNRRVEINLRGGK